VPGRGPRGEQPPQVFAETAAHGRFLSVCEDDYGPFLRKGPRWRWTSAPCWFRSDRYPRRSPAIHFAAPPTSSNPAHAHM
jgi:hypothetical protein